MKRLAVIQDGLCYALFYVLDLCTLYKKQAERGCFFNNTHQELKCTHVQGSAEKKKEKKPTA